MSEVSEQPIPAEVVENPQTTTLKLFMKELKTAAKSDLQQSWENAKQNVKEHPYMAGYASLWPPVVVGALSNGNLGAAMLTLAGEGFAVTILPGVLSEAKDAYNNFRGRKEPLDPIHESIKLK
ncbi:MAG TPA: hypothetical protein VFD45_03155 [Patescibacteria group bacterium]|nr:hypothetical protein [Patescibacteria group bacterium]